MNGHTAKLIGRVAHRMYLKGGGEPKRIKMAMKAAWRRTPRRKRAKARALLRASLVG